jgi:hypothetical protein
MFVDITSQSGLDFHRAVGPPGTYFLPEINGSGGAMFDYDGDGDLDIYLVNSGRSPHAVGDFSASVNTANCLYRQQADGTFSDVTAAAGLGDTGCGVGCAAGDVDNDGDLDIVVTNYGPDRLFLNDGDVDLLVTDLNGRARLFRNDVRKIGHWLLLRVTDPTHQRDAYGAEVVIVEGKRRHYRIVNPAGSYLASHDPRVHVGLKEKQFDHIQVRWPDGPQHWETFDGGDTDRRLSLVRGEGTTAKAPPPVPSQPNTQPDAPPGASGANR